MKLRQLGKTSVWISPIGFGTWPLSKNGRPDEPEAIALLHAVFDAGVNFIDTANSYSLHEGDVGYAERIVARAIAEWRKSEPIYVATKGGYNRQYGKWIANGRPRHLRQACEASLKALGVNEIFLYQLHSPDSEVPYEDSVGELSRLQDEGKIIHIGLSNIDGKHIEIAQKIARIETIQNKLNPLCQIDLHNGVMKACEEASMTYIGYCPIGGTHFRQELSKHHLLLELGQKYDATPQQICLAWAQGVHQRVVPIFGATQMSSVVSSVQAAKIVLNSEDIGAIEQIEMVA